ncbi:MAG: type IV toxin-antitoxin system AbiEi family antitoxin [Propionibacteriaceae bacterium]|nr:type IV toxin-antitoxin system AbiEi family antitoxin [Propionibacteriaceae bacterium]
MNTYAVTGDPQRVPAPMLADWVLSRGYTALTTTEAAKLLEVPASQVRVRLHEPVKRGEWVAISKGLWVPVPPPYRSWGAPPALDFLDALMQHLGRIYYVGWLSAAAIHGAAHHAPQVTQVAVSIPVRNRAAGRNRIEFYTRTTVGRIPVVHHRSATGDVPISSPEATCLDLLANPRVAGGIDNAATVVVGLAEEGALAVDRIGALADRFPTSALRRVGYILENHTRMSSLDQIRRLALGGASDRSLLEPDGARRGRIDQGWNLQINLSLEVES